MTSEICEEKLVSFFKKNITAETGMKENEINWGVLIEANSLDSLSLVYLSHKLDYYIRFNIDPNFLGSFQL